MRQPEELAQACANELPSSWGLLWDRPVRYFRIVGDCRPDWLESHAAARPQPATAAAGRQRRAATGRFPTTAAIWSAERPISANNATVCARPRSPSARPRRHLAPDIQNGRVITLKNPVRESPEGSWSKFPHRFRLPSLQSSRRDIPRRRNPRLRCHAREANPPSASTSTVDGRPPGARFVTPRETGTILA